MEIVCRDTQTSNPNYPIIEFSDYYGILVTVNKLTDTFLLTKVHTSFTFFKFFPLSLFLFQDPTKAIILYSVFMSPNAPLQCGNFSDFPWFS